MSGQMITGEVVSSQMTAEENQQIEYRLASPEQHGANTYLYITVDKKKFSPGDQVAVLYLNPTIHILL